MTYETGRVVAVNTVYHADELAAPVTAGSLYITVRDAGFFLGEGGGWLRVNGEVIQYGDADDETGVITLLSPITADAEEDDAVEVWDFDAQDVSQEVVAHVSVEGSSFNDDPLEATVVHGLIPFLREGIREADAEVVVLEWRGEDLYVVDLPNRRPVMDGSLIDPTTLPESGGSGPTTDGLAPALSPTPTVTGGIRSLFASWTAVDNADPVTYEVYVSKTTPVAISAANLVAETPGTFAVIEAYTSGLPLDTGTHYVAIVARDADGAAPVSTEGSDAVENPFPITETNISDGAVTTPKMVADSILGDRIKTDTLHANRIQTRTISADKLAANLVLSSRIIAGGSETGARVEMNSTGLFAYNSAGTETFRISGATGSVSLLGDYKGTYSAGSVEIGPQYTQDVSIRFRLNGLGYSGGLKVYNDVGEGQMIIEPPASQTTTKPAIYMWESGRIYVHGPETQTFEVSQKIRGFGPVEAENGQVRLIVEGDGWPQLAGSSTYHARVKLLQGATGVQIRNGNDTDYAPLATGPIRVTSGGMDIVGNVNLNGSSGINFGHGGNVLQRMNFGTTTITANASGFGAISHGLGVVPAAVIVIPASHFGASPLYIYDQGGSSASVARIYMRNGDVNTAIASGQTRTVSWVALQ